MSDSDISDASEPTSATPSSFSQIDDTRARPSGREPLPGAPRSEHLVLILAVVVAVFAVLLAKDRPPGVGTTFVLLTGLGAILAMNGRYGLALPSRNRLVVAGALALLALAFSLRASSELLTLNGIAIAAGVVLLSVRVEGRRLRDARASELAIASVELPVASAVRGWHVVSRALRRPASAEGDHRGGALGGHGRDVFLGCLIAIPILGVFATLLAASDTGFRRILERTFNFDVASIADHAITILWVAGIALTALIAALASTPTSRIEERRAEWAGPAVVWIVLGSTCALFAAFLAVQGSYLFGGSAYLEKQTGLTAAEYARDGFYELIVVSGLTVALILAARASFRARVGSSVAYRVLAPLLSLLAIVLLGSAMARLMI